MLSRHSGITWGAWTSCSRSDDMARHEIQSIALAYVRCTCGAAFSPEFLRHQDRTWKSDETLAQETHELFMNHQRDEEK